MHRRLLRISPLYGRISRAGEELDRLNREAIQWHADCVRVRPEVRANPAFGDFFVEISKPAPTVRWATALGGILHSLRSTLDNLVYALRVLDSGWRGLNRDKLAFPICLSKADYRGKSYMIAGLSDDHRAKIEGLQPYRRSNPPHSDLLWCLSSLNNADKHKLLPVTVFSHHAGRFRVTRTRPGTGQVPLPIPGFKAGPVEHGTRLAWYYMPLIEDGMIVQYEPTFSISVDHRGTRLDTDELVRDLIKEVFGVLGQFYPDFPDC